MKWEDAKKLQAPPPRVVHTSTGPQYHPRRESPGHVRAPEAVGYTFDRAHNAAKRINWGKRSARV